MSEPVHLSVSIGPVQTFVAQARRTRDLWAGSWLLSHLTESALIATEGCGVAVIPHRPQPGACMSKGSAIGGMPNRFEVRFEPDASRQDAARAAEQAKKAFDQAWSQVAAAVWDRFVAPIAEHGDRTQSIWSRQVEHFWEFTWVAGVPDPATGTIAHLAAARKRFRDVQAAAEPGTKCALMPIYQELSGHHGRTRWHAQRVFWERVRSQVGTLDLKPSERLGAIALIKRLYPLVMPDAIGAEIADELKNASRPSTAFIAASPWLHRLEGDAKESAIAHAEHAGLDAGFRSSERHAANSIGIPWAAIDGPVWFESGVRVEGAGDSGDSPGGPLATAEHRRIVDRLTQSLKKVHSESGSKPVPFYAVLLLDGDSLGRLLQAVRDPRDVSRRLDRFAHSVDAIVRQGFGETIYAGGDDVMALVPAESAVDVTQRLRQAYLDAFADSPAANVATISASITFAHWRHPIRPIIRTGHALLDDVAKDRTGRDAIAIGVVRRSGLNAVWSVPWRVFQGETTGDVPGLRPFLDLIDRFRSTDDGHDELDRPTFNPSYLHALRHRFARLLDPSDDLPGTYARINADNNSLPLLRDLAHAELRRRMTTRARKAHPRDETESIVEELISLSRPWTREGSLNTEDPPADRSDPNAFGFDGWRVARFLREVRDGKVAEDD